MKYLIEAQAQLDELAHRIDRLEDSQSAELSELGNYSAIVAVDTEFLREKTYYAKLCLVQLGIDDDQYCIDVLSIDDLSILQDLFVNPRVIKLFHAARQDMEVIYQTLGVMPRPIFDTQLAAAFCGADMQIGYSALVEQRLGLELPKSQARTDWSRRPLSDKQIDYAADDVAHLAALFRTELVSLVDGDKLAWYQEELENYYQVDLYDLDPAMAYRRLNGGHLKIAQQYVLQALAEWREKLAQDKNIPRSWICRDDKLFDLAVKRPRNPDDVKNMGVFGRKSAEHYSKQVAELIRGVRVQEQKLWRKIEPLSKQEKSICTELMKKLAAYSKQVAIAQGLLGTRKDIEGLYRDRRSKKLLKGWRQKLVGEPLLSALRELSP